MAQRDRVSGSGREVLIPDDLGSAVVHELVEQVGVAQAQSLVQATVAPGTVRIALGIWGKDIWVNDIAMMNLSASALVNAATTVRVAYRADGDLNLALAGIPLPSPNGVFLVTGFGVGNFPAGSKRKASEFIAGTLGTAITQPFAPFVLPANHLLYVEVVSAELAARLLGFAVDYAVADGIQLQPHNLQRNVFQRVRNFNRRTRRSLFGPS